MAHQTFCHQSDAASDQGGEYDETAEILRILPRGTPRYSYRSAEEMERKISHEADLLTNDQTGERGQYIVFFNISQAVLLQELITERGPLAKLKADYFPESKTLIIKMPTEPHEIAATDLLMAIAEKLYEMGIRPRTALMLTGGVFVSTPTRIKRPDGALRPFQSLPEGRDPKWPTVVIEVGLGESTAKLHRDAVWWLQASEGQVKTALTADVHHGRKTFIIKRWELVDRETRQREQRAQDVQTITLSETEDGAINIRHGPLVIPFRHVLLREPTGRERDFIIGNEDLEELFRAIFRGHSHIR